jgi:hypothetical protein
MKLGAARDQSRSAWRLVVIERAADSATFSYRSREMNFFWCVNYITLLD